ncbi:hypothetical protein KC220_27205, partial [Mycobacterium tuberculosis]|nr:hypothetical protein [Mycobacterium tuberculosis]
DVPDAIWHFHDVVLAFDHLAQRGWLVSSGLPEQADERRAAERAHVFLAALEKPVHTQAPARPPVARNVWQSNFTREAYM